VKSLWALIAAALLSAHCTLGSQPDAGVDLLASLHDADQRSDWLTLPYLLPFQENLRAQGWLETDAGSIWSRRLSVSLSLPLFLPGDKELSLRARCHPSLSSLPL
jgi:hypothetical protein